MGVFKQIPVLQVNVEVQAVLDKIVQEKNFENVDLNVPNKMVEVLQDVLYFNTVINEIESRVLRGFRVRFVL